MNKAVVVIGVVVIIFVLVSFVVVVVFHHDTKTRYSSFEKAKRRVNNTCKA